MNLNKNTLPVTAVFIDYESWFWGLFNRHGEKPNLKAFIQDIKSKGSLQEIYFFADFSSSEEMKKERDNLRMIASDVIDCSSENKKNFTDFIVLDRIYRTVLQHPHIEQYVLVTGDSHFQSVVAFLTTFMDKTVGIYGVAGTLSHRLKESATWFVEIEPELKSSTNLLDLEVKLLDTLKLACRYNKVATFNSTIEYCSQRYKLDKDQLTQALRNLMAMKIITQRVTTVGPSSDTVKVLELNWEAMNQSKRWAV